MLIMLLFESFPDLEVDFVWILMLNFSFNVCKGFTTIICILVAQLCHGF